MDELPTEIKTEQALALVGVPHAALRSIYVLPKRKAPRGSPGRRSWLFSTVHIQRVAVLMKAADLRLPEACRVVAAEVAGRI